MPISVLQAYGLQADQPRVENFGTGLINSTWKVHAGAQQYILQRVNHTVFKQPEDIAYNIDLIAAYLKEHHPDYFFVAPIASSKGDRLIHDSGKGFFRLFPFVAGSHAKEVVETPAQAYEAAVQFGRFTCLLSGLDVHQLKITIPFFHDLTLRYQQFLLALENGDKDRISESGSMIQEIIQHSGIVTTFNAIKTDPNFKLRVTHHDSKISNVLFDEKGKGICVIDLDTVMPGYFISDIGDMMRTYLSPVSEEETETGLIEVREEFYRAIVQGYMAEMKDELTQTEREHVFFAGKFMIYMQAIRFLTDHINNDVYYGARYRGHNFQRARNQLMLLKQLMKKETKLRELNF